MDTVELKKQREDLETFFAKLYEEDKEELKGFAIRYANGDQAKMDAFLEGYKHAFKQPHSRTIRLIVMYTLDYIPYYRKVPTIKNIATSIRNIFRNKLYPEGLLNGTDNTNINQETSESSKE